MKRLSIFLEGLIRDLGYEKRLEAQRVLDSWPAVVGERIAQVSQAERIENGILYVKVDNSAWRNELSLEMTTILELLQEKSRTKVVKEIRFV